MNEQRFQELTARFASLRIAVIGDLFLDRILYINREWDEPSVETGLTAYQVHRRLNAPGAAGVVTNNLYSLGIKEKYAVNVVGDDGESYDLFKALESMGVSIQYMVRECGRFTPTYTKTFFEGEKLVETHRIDSRNRMRMLASSEKQVIRHLLDLESKVDAMVCLEQIPYSDYGVFTEPVIATLQAISARGKVRVLVDSRYNLGRFGGMIWKCNDHECLRSAGITEPAEDSPLWLSRTDEAIEKLQKNSKLPLFVSCGSLGMKVCAEGNVTHIPAFHVQGPVDICGAGDSALTGIACALCAGATAEEAALFGNLIASLIIQQLGVTGMASLQQLTARFYEYETQQKEEKV